MEAIATLEFGVERSNTIGQTEAVVQSTRIDQPADRSISPLVGTVAMIAVMVCLAAVLASLLGSWATVSSAPTASFAFAAEADDDRLVLTHTGGDPLEVDSLSVFVSVEGRPLEHQPPIPFFAARGFTSGPTGPINSRWGTDWTVGETGTFRIASTNSASIDVGDRVIVRIVADDRLIAILETRAV